jgi:predicted transcriptional regulator
MPSAMHAIEVDEATATKLRARAAEKGMSVSQLVAELISVDSDAVDLDSETIAELERRWRAIQAGARTVSNEEVVRWLRTWGTPEFKSWHDR